MKGLEGGFSMVERLADIRQECEDVRYSNCPNNKIAHIHLYDRSRKVSRNDYFAPIRPGILTFDYGEESECLTRGSEDCDH